MKKIIIIDSNALMHRAYHALPELKTPEGQLVNVVYGFANILFKAISELGPDYISAVFDLKGVTFRQKQYSDYKAKRVKPAQEFYDQIPIIKQMLKLFQIPIYTKQGYEADDVIGAIVSKNNKRYPKLKNIILTGDLDLLQLVNRQNQVYLLKTGISRTVIYGKKEVELGFGLSPKQVVDYKALRGDASDNIPGVPGVGDKTALELVKNFSSLEQLYQKIGLSDLNPKLKARLLEYKRQAFLSYDLAKIRKDIDVGFNLSEARWGKWDKNKLINFFEKLEFTSLIKRLSVL